jgi:hypothetical protein
MDVDNNKTKKQIELGRNRGIPKTQLGFSLDQYFVNWFGLAWPILLV